MHEALAGERSRLGLARTPYRLGDPLGELAGDLLSELDDQALGGSLAHARCRLKALGVARGDRPQKLARRTAGEDRHGDLRANAGDGGEMQE